MDKIGGIKFVSFSHVWAAYYLFISDIPAGTPAVVAQSDVGEDDDDEPPLNENDDDDFDDVDQVEEQNTQHLVLAQFDKVVYLSSCTTDA
jgi:hypothetical protein